MEMLNVNTTTFTVPSGAQYTIREQNGQDEEVLTNVAEANRGMNITNFLQGIIMSSSYKNGKLSIKEVMDIPVLDRQCILIKSRIFSIGEELEFSYKWPKQGEDNKFEEFEYTQDLNEYLFDYANRENITEEELLEKPNAIPFYPGEVGGIEHTLKSGKKIRFHVADGNTELSIFKMRAADQTRNTDLIMRGLELEVDGKWDRVTNFSLFTVKDMREMRKLVNAIDPMPNLVVDIENPNTSEHQEIPLMALSSFFFPEEDV